MSILLREGRCPFDQLGKNRSERRVVELVDHLDRDIVDKVLDLLEVRGIEHGFRRERDLLPAEVKHAEEDACQDGKVLHRRRLGVLLDAEANGF